MYIIKSLYVNEYQLYTLLFISELVHHKQQINMQNDLHWLPSIIKRKIPIELCVCVCVCVCVFFWGGTGKSANFKYTLERLVV